MVEAAFANIVNASVSDCASTGASEHRKQEYYHPKRMLVTDSYARPAGFWRNRWSQEALQCFHASCVFADPPIFFYCECGVLAWQATWIELPELTSVLTCTPLCCNLA